MANELSPIGALPPRDGREWMIHYGGNRFTLHSKRGHALNAIQRASDCVLYFLGYNEIWEEVFRLENYRRYKDYPCSKCGGVAKSMEHKYKWIHNLDKSTRLLLCRNCA
jgi:hypothetical protein